MLCVWCSRCSSQDDRIWQSYMKCGMMLWLLLTSSLLSLFLCLKDYSLFFLWPLLHNAQTKIAIVYMREQTWGTMDDMIPRWYCMVCNGRYGSLMCTSNVAGNAQMASHDRQVTQNGLGVNNAIAREYTMVSSRLPSLAMMSGGVLDVDTKMMETRP